MLRGTSFQARTSALCQARNWRRWGGYVVAGSYELTHDREYYSIRSTAALIDVSPLYKYLIHGPDAERFLNHVVTRNVAKCAVNQVVYTPWCDDAGKAIDDGTLSRLSGARYRTPIRHLYLCGAGTHPGGGVTGMPGYNAARAILRDVKRG